VGGLTHDGNGISTFHLARNGVDAKKSWFYLNGILVCLGVDISANKIGNEIITAVNQCKQHGKAFITFKEGKTIPVIDTLIHSSDISSVWHDSIGYYFPEKTSTSISVIKQNGSWYDIADSYSSELISEKVFKLWINHGINPAASSYEYMVLPAISQDQLKEYIQHPDIEIMMNSKSVQAVKMKNNFLLQFVFHEPTCATTFSDSDFIETKIPGLVMLEKDRTNNLTITVADPTQTQKVFSLVISGRYTSKFSRYNALKNQTELDIILPQKEYAGSQVSAQLIRNE
jgi:hypothetical protein